MRMTLVKSSSKYLSKIWMILLLFVFCIPSIGAQEKTLSGTVIDEQNEPMIGVSVAIKGTTNGTITDIDGKFSLNNSNPDAVLVFSFVGYTPVEMKVAGKTHFDIQMKEDRKLLDEVVVIGFQSQKKENLTAAVTSVDSKVLENRPVSNVGQALQGMVPGLNVSINGGSPNAVPKLNIRGATTIQQRGKSGNDRKKFDVVAGSPLILLDGIEITQDDLNQINPNDIDNMSFLKDASAAAIYGTRATFGVILVQTKSGSYNQKAKVSYSFDMTFDQPYELPDILNSATIYRAQLNQKVWTGEMNSYTDENNKILAQMEAYIKDPKNNKPYYMDGSTIKWAGNTNPYKELVKDWTSTQKHNLSISGGSDKVTYYFSLGVQDQDGMYEIRTDNMKRYNAMLSVNAKVTNWFNIAAKASYNETKYTTPTFREDGANLWLYAKSYYPEDYIFKPVLTGPDDERPNFQTEHPVSYLYVGGTSKEKRKKTILSVSPEFIIIPKELKIKADLSITPTTFNKEKTHPRQDRVNTSWVSLENRWATLNTGEVTRTTTDQYTINVYADYNKTFNEKHNMSALLGVNQERESYGRSILYLNNMIDPHILTPSLSNDVTTNTSVNDHHVLTSRALFGRLMYNYDSRYLVEFDARYDGSSRFPKNDRFQFFPTVSVGWRLSEEKFMDFTKTWLDNLKVRASWGKLGSQPDDYYPYQSTYDTEEGYFLFDGSRYPVGIKPLSLVDPNLTWQESTTKNLGFDVTALNNRLTLTADIYERKVTDILIAGAKQYSALLGVPSYEQPLVNEGSIKTTGYEISARWQDQLSNGLSYGVGVSLADDRAKVLSYPANSVKTLGDGMLYSGYNVGDIWGYVTGGILQEEDLIALTNSKGELTGKYTYNGAKFKSEQLYPGYLWYVDLDRDGIITSGDNTADNPGDRKIIGNESPRYKYSITANLQYKGFDLDVMFQGVGKRDYWINSNSSYWGNGAGSLETFNKSWRKDENNPSLATKAKFPMYGSTIGGRTQSGYLIDGSYFKLKQVVLGYSLPQSILNKVYLTKLRFYVSGYNLLSFTDIPKYMDTDYISDAYPPKRTFAFGVQVGF